MNIKPQRLAEWELNLTEVKAKPDWTPDDVMMAIRDGTIQKFQGFPRRYYEAIFRVTEMMGDALDQGKSPAEAYTMIPDDFTAFMCGICALLISTFSVHGDEFKNWWNTKYGVDGKGVANPALMRIEPLKDEDFI